MCYQLDQRRRPLQDCQIIGIPRHRRDSEARVDRHSRLGCGPDPGVEIATGPLIIVSDNGQDRIRISAVQTLGNTAKIACVHGGNDRQAGGFKQAGGGGPALADQNVLCCLERPANGA